MSAAAAAKEFGAMVRHASVASRTPSLLGDPIPVPLLPSPSSASVLLPGRPAGGSTVPLPAAETLGLALGPGVRGPPIVARFLGMAAW